MFCDDACLALCRGHPTPASSCWSNRRQHHALERDALADTCRQNSHAAYSDMQAFCCRFGTVKLLCITRTLSTAAVAMPATPASMPRVFSFAADVLMSLPAAAVHAAIHLLTAAVVHQDTAAISVLLSSVLPAREDSAICRESGCVVVCATSLHQSCMLQFVRRLCPESAGAPSYICCCSRCAMQPSVVL
jgi:hypothetical protein